MLTANLKFINKSSGFFSFFAMFYIGNRITSDSYSRSKYLGHPFVKTNMFHYVPIKHKQLSFMSNGGIFKLYTVPNGLLFSSLTQPRFSFERMLPTECPKNGVLTMHYGVEKNTVNARKMFYWTYLLIWQSLKVALNRSIILKYMYKIVMTATSNRIYILSQSTRSLTINI
jgi:hypothetical protein